MEFSKYLAENEYNKSGLHLYNQNTKKYIELCKIFIWRRREYVTEK